MNQTIFFIMLGAPLKNPRWSWGAVRPEDGAVFLRVWQDRMRVYDGSQFAQVTFTTHPGRHRCGPDHGHRERLKQVDRVRDGAPCYLILCHAIDPTAIPRRTRDFNPAEVFPGGRVVELDGDWWVQMLPGMAVQEVMLSLAGDRA